MSGVKKKLKNPDAVRLGRLGGRIGGRLRWAGTTKAQRSAEMRRVVNVRWAAYRATESEA